jgi:nucleoside-diphosphate-sugar epimerase
MPDLEGRRILVLGAAGFIGANLVRELIAQGSVVFAAVRKGRQRLAAVEDDIELVEVDVLLDGSIEHAVERARPEVAVNLVVAGGHPQTSGERFRQLEVAVLGTSRLVEALSRVGCPRLVHLGSSLEYGPRDRAHREEDALAPVTARGAAKASETIACLGLARALSVPTVVLRPFTVYGPMDHESRLVPTAIRAAIEDRELPLTEPGLVHDYVHVDDVVRAICRAAIAPSCLADAVFNVGTGIQTTNERLVELVENVVGRRVRTKPGAHPGKVHDRRVWLADTEKARAELGWSAASALEDGLRSTLSWHLALRGR